jgi:hypothetical protein
MVVAACTLAIGSVFGYDLILPKVLNIVSDNRLYKLPDMKDGILQAKQRLLELHKNLSMNGFSEQFVHHQGNVRIPSNLVYPDIERESIHW